MSGVRGHTPVPTCAPFSHTGLHPLPFSVVCSLNRVLRERNPPRCPISCPRSLQSALLGRTRHGRTVRVASAVSCRSRGGQEPARRIPINKKNKKKHRLQYSRSRRAVSSCAGWLAEVAAAVCHAALSHLIFHAVLLFLIHCVSSGSITSDVWHSR